MDRGEEEVCDGPRIAIGARRFSALGPVPGSYLRALATAGGDAVVLEPAESSAASADAHLASCAGLLLTGGGDVWPDLYGGSPDAGLDDVDPLRDAFELGLLDAAARRGLPVLAICHGMQLLNVARGGRLRQRLPPEVAGAHGTREAWTRHAVRVRPAGRLARAVGAGELDACSSHHQQSVARLGAGLVEAGWSEDGVVEAVEGADGRWVVGVQWHPEDTAGDDPAQQRIFDAFVAAACACAVAA